MRCKDAHDCKNEPLPGSLYCARHTGSLAARDAAVVLKLRAQKNQLLDALYEATRSVNDATLKLVKACGEAIK